MTKPRIRSGADGSGPRLAEITGDLMGDWTAPAIEVGPGYSKLPAIGEDPEGGGPLVAIAAGAIELERNGWAGPAIVLASDLPRAAPALIAWLVSFPPDVTVVPLVGGRSQPLCSHLDHDVLRRSIEMVESGIRSMHEFLRHVDHRLAGPDDWGPAGVDDEMFTDLDTPADLARYRSTAAPGLPRDRDWPGGT